MGEEKMRDEVVVLLLFLVVLILSVMSIGIEESSGFLDDEVPASEPAEPPVAPTAPTVNPFKDGDRITCSFPFVPYSETSGELASFDRISELEFVIEDAEVFLEDSLLRGDENLCAFAEALLRGGAIEFSTEGDPVFAWCTTVSDLAHGVRCARASNDPAGGSQHQKFEEEKDIPPVKKSPSRPNGRMRVILATGFA
jgi:hypothetical protein